MMKCIKSVIVVVACLCGLPLFGDNLRLSDAVRVVSATDQAVELEVSLSWNNSWRTRHNWDAVYLFGKYQVSGSTVWHHLYFSLTAGSHSSAAAVDLLPVNGGRGLFVRRSAEGNGAMTVTLRLTANPKGNASSPFTSAAVNSGSILFSMQGIEMVQIPTAPFYAGDRSAPGAFSDGSFGSLLPEYDLINTTSGYTYSANGSESSSANASRAANRNPQGTYNASSRQDWCGTAFPAWWQVDFKTAKEIRYFGVSGVSGLTWGGFPPAPAGEWFLEGSNDASVWHAVWSGGPESWGQSSVSYPVQSIRVTFPGSYRYYRIRVEDTQCPALWNNIRISNVGMTEEDLASLPSAAPVSVALNNTILPGRYPSGFHGFYAMKYELTQEQYVTFLNMLSRPAQHSRTVGGLLEGYHEGDYIFGDAHDVPSFRNGIVLQQRPADMELPCVFACDVTGTDLDNSETDGQSIACNYLSPADMLAYADWSGLRPLSELEYEKMCRENFPEIPAGGSFAWGSTAVVPLPSLLRPGRETEGVPDGDPANANIGGGIDGPVRVGLFTRPGDRKQAGLSGWGVSDLTGNLNEIYCNTELYGRQLDRTIHGGGAPDGAGNLPSSGWPLEKEAYGVRGGDYATPVASASAFDRSGATDYFSDLGERKPTTGFRLGFSQDLLSIATRLTLENGLRSSTSLVYDTVCASGSYCITGDRHGEEGTMAAYFWHESTDDGASWQLLEETGCDLTLQDLTGRIPDNTVGRFRYKRVSTRLDEYSETGEVCLVVAHGYAAPSLSETLSPCMESPTLEVSTPLPAVFSWRCLETEKTLTPQSGSANRSVYTVRTVDLKQTEDSRPNGRYDIMVDILMAGRCRMLAPLQVWVELESGTPFETESLSVSYSNDGTYRIPRKWGGADAQQWKFVGAVNGSLSIDEATGVVSGMTSTLIRNITVEAVCEAFPNNRFRIVLNESSRTYAYTGGVQSVTLPAGTYKLEVWGAEGGGSRLSGNTASGLGGYGGYATGTTTLSTATTFYLFVGGYGASASTGNAAGGWNGGGQGYASSSGEPGSGGGGASDIRLTNGAWNAAGSLYSRIIIGGGGGGGGEDPSDPYGHGGGLTGTNGAGAPSNGTQSAAGTGGGLGYGGGTNAGDGGGGGGGLFGGGTAASASVGTDTQGGGGGSGYVKGCSGCNTSYTSYQGNLTFSNITMTAGQRTGNGSIRIIVL